MLLKSMSFWNMSLCNHSNFLYFFQFHIFMAALQEGGQGHGNIDSTLGSAVFGLHQTSKWQEFHALWRLHICCSNCCFIASKYSSLDIYGQFNIKVERRGCGSERREGGVSTLLPFYYITYISITLLCELKKF